MSLELILLFIAGIGAGIVTGLFGGSATLAVVPIMVIFGGYTPYQAIGIGLSIDIFASLAAFVVYYKNKEVDFKPAIPLTVFALIGVVLGSFISAQIPIMQLMFLTGAGIVFASFSFFRKHKLIDHKETKHQTLVSSFLGLLVGLILGTWGTGGGVALLLALTIGLGYEIHMAVGTSVLIMVFLAAFGGATHYVNTPFSLIGLAAGALGGIIGSVLTSKFAISLSERKLDIIVGICILLSGISLILKSLGML
jgi:uncharacterized protein